LRPSKSVSLCQGLASKQGMDAKTIRQDSQQAYSSAQDNTPKRATVPTEKLPDRKSRKPSKIM